MPWLRLSLYATDRNAEEISDLLMEAGAVSVSLEDAADQPVYETLPGETRVWAHTQVIGLFSEDTDASAVLNHIRHAINDSECQATITTLPDQDWARAWMERFHPLRFGTRLWVVPHWHISPDPQGINISLDPGLAFGTGTHATTALCLEWLDQHHVCGLRVIDYGCGSGILAIAAAKLGAQQVWAVDHDPQALQASRENTAANEVGTNIDTYLPDELPAITVDIILANILAEPLINLAPYFAQRVCPNGWIVLSGILTEQIEEVLASYCPWFNMESPVIRGEWARLSGQRL